MRIWSFVYISFSNCATAKCLTALMVPLCTTFEKLTKFDRIKNDPYLLEYWSIQNEIYTNWQLGVLAVQRCLFSINIGSYVEKYESVLILKNVIFPVMPQRSCATCTWKYHRQIRESTSLRGLRMATRKKCFNIKLGFLIEFRKNFYN